MGLGEVEGQARGHASGKQKHLDSNAGLCDFKVTSDLPQKDFPPLEGTTPFSMLLITLRPECYTFWGGVGGNP